MNTDYEYIDAHVKNITESQFTVFITEPISLEIIIHYSLVSAYYNVRRLIRSSDRGYTLTGMGRYYAKKALDSLNKKAAFFMLHRTEFQGFLDDYHHEYKSMEALLSEAKRELKQTTWRDRADAFRKKMNLQKSLESLYHDMYRGRYGEDAAFLYEEEIVVLLSSNE